jgi:hypothetical protein
MPGSTFTAGSTINLLADAAVRNGSVSEVQFFANGHMIGSATTSPFSFNWTSVAPGNYSITAVAIAANSALSSTSAPLRITVLDYGARNVQYGDSISMDFGDYNVTPMGPTEIAGVVARANWNGTYANAGALAGLVNQNGASTTATAIWSSANMYYTNIPDQPGNDRMMKGYQDTGNIGSNITSATFQITGIPYRLYDVYVYFDGANGTASREANYRLFYTAGGCSSQAAPVITGLDAANTDFNGTFTQASGGSAGNYVVFPGCSGRSVTLLAVHGASSDTTYRAPVNGIQIVAIKGAIQR